MKIKTRLKNKLKCILKADKLSLDNNKKIYIILAADYGNLGDIAITYAQKEYLKNKFSQYDVIEIPTSKFYNYYLFLKHNINKEDIITIIGGGNMGNLYEDIEDIRRKTIKTFKNNLIISFPQTIYFTENKKGVKSLKKTQSIYEKHKKLILFAREEESYNYMKNHFKKNEIYLTPDIVFTLKNKIKSNNHKGNNVGLCLRNDKEKMLTINSKSEIKNQLKQFNVKNINTHIGDNNLIYKKRYDQLFELLKEIRNVNFLITDRLHGMIFSYITKTPCIVFDNSNHKIKSSYETWLKKCSYIKLLEQKDIKSINKYLNDIISTNKKDIILNDKFKIIEESIKRKI